MISNVYVSELSAPLLVVIFIIIIVEQFIGSRGEWKHLTFINSTKRHLGYLPLVSVGNHPDTDLEEIDDLLLLECSEE